MSDIGEVAFREDGKHYAQNVAAAQGQQLDEGDLLTEARSFLHDYQAEAIAHLLGTSDGYDRRLVFMEYSPWYGQDLSAVTRDYFDEYSAVETVPGATGRVRRGPFTYDAQIETLRTAQGRALVERSQPGPFEHPRYLALLARQAGSIELAETALNRVPDELFRRIILGCAPDPDIDSRTRALEADRAAVVIANTGLVDFVFRSAKPVIRATQPEVKGGRVSSTRDLARIEKFLEATKDDSNGPVRQFQLLIAQHLYGNVSEGGDPAKAVEHPPLGVLTSIAERFVLAHEYGHCFVRPDQWDPNILPPHIKEVYRDPKFAEGAIDSRATITTIWSAAEHDGFEPLPALAAVLFSPAMLRDPLPGDQDGDDRFAPGRRARE